MRDWKRIVTVVLAAALAVRALTNVFKPLGAGTGLVFFGKLLHGIPNLILAPAVGIYMLIYAYGMYDRRQYTLPMGIAYAVFVVFNVCLFPLLEGLPPGWGSGLYGVFGIASIVSGFVLLGWMWIQRDELID